MTKELSQLAALRSLRESVDDPQQRAVLDEIIAVLEATARAASEASPDVLSGSQTGNRQITISDDAQIGVSIAGDVHGNIFIHGSRTRSNAELLATYLQRLIGRLQNLRLRGIQEQRHINDGSTIDLEQIYVHPTVTVELGQQGDSSFSIIRGETIDSATEVRDISNLVERRTLMETMASNRYLVLLGDPGSGKTTALNYIALSLAETATDSSFDITSRLINWPFPSGDGRLLPILLSLLQLAKYLFQQDQDQEEDDLWAYVADYLEEGQRYSGLSSAIYEELEAGRLLLLLDGLDEVASPELRRRVSRSIISFAQAYPKTRIIVTCRTRVYEGEQNKEWQLPQWPVAILQGWSLTEINRFIEAWYASATSTGNISGSAALERSQALKRAIEQRSDLERIAKNPLLLTIMTLIHFNDDSLPEERAALYERSIEILLNQWELTKEATSYGSLMDYINLPDADMRSFRPLLSSIAFAAHGASNNTNRIDRSELEALILQALAERRVANTDQTAGRFLEYIDTRAGLLQAVDNGTAYSFPHLTFQEYLAGVEVVRGVNPLQRLLERRNDERWRMPILLGIGRMFSEGNLDVVYQFLASLASMEGRIYEQERRDLLLASEIISDLGSDRLIRADLIFRRVIEQISERLKQLGAHDNRFELEWLRFTSKASSHEEVLQVAKLIANRISGAIHKSFSSSPQVHTNIAIFFLNTGEIFEDTGVLPTVPVVFWLDEVLQASSAFIWRRIKALLPGQCQIALAVMPVEDTRVSNQIKAIRTSADADGVDLVVFGRTEIDSILNARDPRLVFHRLILAQVNIERISPYQTEGAVSGRRFFGRESEIRTIRDRIFSTSFTLVGSRRVGKSSILQRLAETELRQLETIPLYLQMQDAHKTDGQLNYRTFVRRLCEVYAFMFDEQLSVDNLEDFLSAIPTGKPLVLLIDEADGLIAADRRVGWRLFSELRQLAQNKRCQSVFAGELALRQVHFDAETPFFNFASEIVIGRFDRSVTGEVFQRPMEQMGVKLVDRESSVKIIYDFTGGHPNVVQRLCARLVRRLKSRTSQRELTPRDVNAIIQSPSFQREDFLNTYLQRTSVLEQLIMLKLSASERPMTRSALAQELASHGVRPSVKMLETALQTLVSVRQMLDYTQDGYQCVIRGFSVVLGNGILGTDKFEELMEEYHSRSSRNRRK